MARLFSRLFFRLMFWIAVLCVPLLGVWLASSWAAYSNGPHWFVLLAGLMLFPLLPLLWELWAERRRARRLARQGSSGFFSRLGFGKKGERATRFSDRLLMRTLALNLSFIGVLLWFWPGQTLTAVGARGDWMLDGVKGVPAARMRSALRTVSDRLQHYNGDFSDDEFTDDADVIDDRLPEAGEVGEGISVVRGEREVAELTLVLPPGARGQLDAEVWTGTHTLTLALRPHSLGVVFEDGRKLKCPVDATVGRVELVEGWTLGERACEELLQPNPTWRPELRIESRRYSRLSAYEGLGASELEDAKRRAASGFLEQGEILAFDGERKPYVLGPVVVPAGLVAAVHRNDPWLRIEVAAESRGALCDTTRLQRNKRLVAVVDSEVRYARLIGEALCDGFVPIDTATPIQTEWQEEVAPDAESGVVSWPLSDTPHAALSRIPDERQDSIKLLGEWMEAESPTELDRARLVHDWVATQVRYDVASLEAGKRAPQDADTVFRRKTGVCAGYANLVRALGRAAGLDVVYLTGNVRAGDGSLAGSRHAWNAVKVDGKWLLMDATWGSGFTNEKGEFQFKYRTAWLFGPPELFRRDHLPDQEAWQLSAEPLSRGEFLRLPLMGMEAAAMGLTLVQPTAPQVQARGTLTLTLESTQRAEVVAQLGALSCTTTGTTSLSITCPVPPSGIHDLRLFARDFGEQGAYRSIGRVNVQAN